MPEQEDKRIRRTKKLLRQALTRLMEQKDFQSITVTDVVREADINRGTFYAHYRDVYDLRETIESEMISDFRGMIVDIRPDEINTSLRPVLARSVDYLGENREIVQVLMNANGPDSFGRKLIEVIEECRLAVLPSVTLEDTYLARFIATGLVGILEKWVRDERAVPKRDIVALMARKLELLLPAENA